MVNDFGVGVDYAAYRCHALGESIEYHVYLIGNAVVLGSTATVGSHRTEPMGVVNQYAERIFLLELHYVGKMPELAGPAEHSLGDNQHAAALLVGQPAGMVKLFLEACHVVVAEGETLGEAQTHTVQNAGM